MNNEEKENFNFIKSNIDTPDIVNEKINSTFNKIKNETKKGNTKNKNIVAKVAIIIVAIFLCGNAISLAFGGSNIYTMIYEYFKVSEEEKVNDIIIEGIKEEVDYVGLKSSIGYTIQYDKEYINLTRENEKDIYRSNIDGIEDKVYFTIEYLDKRYDEAKAENKENNIEEHEINGENAFTVTFIDNVLVDETQSMTWKWDSDVKTLWYIDAGKGTYLIEEHYFYEATEGWGVRIAQMINTFKVNK